MNDATGTKILTDEEKRAELRDKISAGETRNAERSLAEQAQKAADDALDFVRENPLKTMGAVVIGALLIGALTRPGRELGRKAGGMASVASDAAIAYAMGLLDSAGDAAEEGQEALADLGHTMGRKARKWQAAAVDETDGLTNFLAAKAKRGSTQASRSLGRLRKRIQS